LHYLANLCHGCGECFYACQYAPPHQFAVNVPQALAAVRAASYEEFAAPRLLARAFHNNGVVAAFTWAASLLAAISLTMVLSGGAGLWSPASLPGDFYAVVPHTVMAGVFSAAGLAALLALAAGCRRFWRAMKEPLPAFDALWAALRDVLRLEYLRSGGAGCTYPDERHSAARRWLHHATFYGFLLCFASTTVAAFYHYFLDSEAPYPYWSLPVVLGTAGGLGLVIGPAGLYALKRRQDPMTASPPQRGLDTSFLALLFFTSATGLLLLALRETTLMGFLLVVHLGTVMALFLLMPYGKFVHGIYRTAALVRYAMERARPNKSPEGGNSV
jgi:citrate/tricarballylate utilization protein